ncbi:putative symporter YcgO [Chlamydiales bacterium STE3]|nr:putative symporter YcgO [Chlamydiales bacterium STE3]
MLGALTIFQYHQNVRPSMQSQILIAFFSYLLIILAIGLFSHSKQTTSADFVMGNRSLNFWLTALTAHASDMSAWLFMAFPAALFIKGLPGLWIALGLIGGMYLNWQFIAEKLRVETERYNSYTLSTYFERRFFDSTGVIRILTALMSVLFLTTYLAAGLYGMGLLFGSLFGINQYVGLPIAIFVVMAYTFFGGFVTVAWTDFFQGIYLLIVLIATAIYAFFSLPSSEFISQVAQEKGISLSLIPDLTFTSTLTLIFLILEWGLGYYGQPHIVTKFMGIKTPSEIRKAKFLGMSWQIISLGAAAAIGILGIGLFPNGLQNPELVFVEIVKLLFHPLFVGFILCGVIAANMSTMDSQILVCASVLSEDLYKCFFKRNASPKELLVASRASVILVSLTSLLIAFYSSSSILEMVLYAWSGLGCSFGPLVIASLYFKKANRQGAIAGIITGGTLAATWPFINFYIIDYTIPAMIPGFFLGLLSIYLVSYITNGFKNKTAQN